MLPHDELGRALLDVGEIGFEDEAGLEALVRRSMDKSWRSVWCDAVEKRMRERFSMDAFARDTISLVQRSFT